MKGRLFAFLMVLLLFGGIASAESGVSAETHAWQAYNGKRLGVLVGPLMEDIAHESFPDSEYLLLNGYPDCIAALLAGKIDGYLGDEVALKAVIAEQPTISYIPEYLTYNEYNFAFRKNDPASDALREELNDWLAQSWADGTMREIDSIWFGADEARKTVDLPDATGENGTIRVVTTSTDMPFSYIKDGQNVGYDIDVVARFCKARGYGLELVDVDFAARIPTLQSGKADFTTSMNVTPERQEEVNFCNLVSSGGIVLAVKAEVAANLSSDGNGTTSVGEDGVYTSLDELSGKRVGVKQGTVFDNLVSERLPDALIQYFKAESDMIIALETGKIDGFAAERPSVEAAMEQDDAFTYITGEYLNDSYFGFVFPKGDEQGTLESQFDEFLDAIKSDGTLDDIYNKWFGSDHALRVMEDYENLPDVNGTVKMATSGVAVPFTYVQNNRVIGYDIEIAAGFCRAYGYHLVIEIMDFDGIIPAVQSGKVDFAGSGITITEERAQSIDFSDSYYVSHGVIAVMKKSTSHDESFLSQVWSSFNKTFLRESRWKLFLEGIGNTLLITLLSILFGTLLGFLLFMLCRNGNIVANGITNFCLWLVQGTPGVVLLMILYYIIFGSVAISGIAVAVIGFTLTFGAAVFGLIKMGVGTIDRGQYEAAYALGHSNRHTFFKIILPQAIPRVLPAYQGEIVGLIKATAIVGYIAVQDLTKMGDIVRSRTYEAFFPLIAVTIIYFVLEGLFSFLVSRVRVSIDPKRRKRESILKGVNLHD